MKISGHKLFDRYHIVSTDDVTNAMRRLELNGNGESLVKVPKKSSPVDFPQVDESKRFGRVAQLAEQLTLNQ